jgi:hypothetical protein
MTLNLKQIWTWNSQQRLVDTLFINVEQIAVIEHCEDDPEFDPTGVFLSLDGNGPALGLSIWQVTMNGGRKTQVPVPWNYKSSIWEQLQIDAP